eukprot:m.1652629 g.1652629  ORF g.1652629 m.1652629 type:complete len:54 (-) comp93864_c0_seq1:249-410(-)
MHFSTKFMEQWLHSIKNLGERSWWEYSNLILTYIVYLHTQLYIKDPCLYSTRN